jgi:hypothetical protein
MYRSRSKRVKVWQHAKVVVGSNMIHCMVRDISSVGAKLSIDRNVQLPEVFDLYIAAHDLRYYRAQLRWRKAGLVGVSLCACSDENAVEIEYASEARAVSAVAGIA